jgi:hypothetical protein
MARYTKDQSIAINRCIHDTSIANLSQLEALKYIEEKTGIQLGRTSYNERKRQLRIAGIRQWNRYRKDDYALRLDMLERINVVKKVQENALTKMLQFDLNPKTFFQWKTAAYAVMESNKQLVELQLLVPEIDAIGHGDNGLSETIKTGTYQQQETRDTQAVF